MVGLALVLAVRSAVSSIAYRMYSFVKGPVFVLHYSVILDFSTLLRNFGILTDGIPADTDR